jgi:UDP-glucose 4-epimerase
MKILITGSSGHLGEALIRVLKSLEHEVIGIDILPSEYTQFVGSISDINFLRPIMKDVEAVLHTATLHKPHVATHSRQDFVDTNITGTLNLLETAVENGCKSFIFTSTTSTFGNALTPAIDEPAVWITEQVTPIPKNIYGITKTAAEDLCYLFYRNKGLPCIILRTSRFFIEDDDQKSIRDAFSNENAKANELLFRRVDIEDVVSAHLCALEKATIIGFRRYIISATTPFTQTNLVELNQNAATVVKCIFPDFKAEYEKLGWEMFPTIGRVYVNDLAREELKWQPKYDFRYVLNCLKSGSTIFSPLSKLVGMKGYHAVKFQNEPYPVD